MILPPDSAAPPPDAPTTESTPTSPELPAGVYAVLGPLDRAAHASIRGYLYQITYSALQWLDLGENELLIVEGREDIDRYLLDEHGKVREATEIQLKNLKGAVSARSEPVLESIFNFLLSYHYHQQHGGHTCRMTFVTTASQSAQRKAPGECDILATWATLGDQSPAERPAAAAQLSQAIQKLFDQYLAPRLGENSTEGRRAQRIRDTLAWLTQDARWEDFFDAVSWYTDQGSLQELNAQLEARISEHRDFNALPARECAQALIHHALKAASSGELRHRALTRHDLRAVSNRTTTSLHGWVTQYNLAAFTTWQRELSEMRAQIDDHEGRLCALEATRSRTTVNRAQILSQIEASAPRPPIILKGVAQHKVTLDRVYVPVSLEYLDAPVQRPEGCGTDETERRRQNAREDLDRWCAHNADESMILVGEMGAGKSELLFSLFTRSIKHANEAKDHPLPIWLAAQRLPKTIDIDTLPTILKISREQLADLPQSASPTFRLFLDGFDESQFRAQKLIDLFQEHLGSCLRGIAVTTRPGYSPQVWGARSVKVVPWSRDRIDQFLYLWAQHVDPDGAKSLRSSPSFERVIETISNPLLASFCAHIASKRPSSLRNRTELLRAVVDHIMTKWCERRASGLPFTIPQILDRLGPLALCTVSSEYGTISFDDLRRAVAPSDDDPLSLEEKLKGDFGLLTELDDGFIFTIRGLAEYIAGRELLRRGEDALLDAARHGWGVEPARHAIALSHARSPEEAQRLFEALLHGEADDDIAFSNGRLRPVIVAALAAADLGSELPEPHIAPLVAAVMRRVSEEWTSWVGIAMLDAIAPILRLHTPFATALRDRMIQLASDHSGRRAQWYLQFQPSCPWELIRGLTERDPEARIAVCRRLAKHVEQPLAQDVLGSELFDDEDHQHTMPSIEAGLALRHAPRTPEFTPFLTRLVERATNGDQMPSYAATLALRPGEAPIGVLIQGVLNGKEAGYHHPEILEDLASSAEGANALTEAWPEWRRAQEKQPERSCIHPDSPPTASPPPSWSTRCRIAERIAPILDSLEPERLESLLQHGDVLHSLAHEALRFPPTCWRVVLPALLRADPCAKGRAALRELGRRDETAARIICETLRKRLDSIPAAKIRQFEAGAIEPLVAQGDTDATALYSQWLDNHAFFDSWPDDDSIDPRILAIPAVEAAYRRSISQWTTGKAIHWPRLPLRCTAPLWQGDESIWHALDQLLNPFGSNLRFFLEITRNSQLPAWLESRLHDVLTEFITRHGAPTHPQERDYWHDAADYLVNVTIFRQYPSVLLPTLQGLAGKDADPPCTKVALHAAVALGPRLSLEDRRRLSEACARRFARHPESIAHFPQQAAREFIAAAVDSWIDTFHALVAGVARQPRISGPLRALHGVLPKTKQREAAIKWRDQVRGQELPWLETRWPNGRTRLADEARQLIFESGGVLDLAPPSCSCGHINQS